MNKLKYLLSTILVALCATSCVDILDDNVNPDRAHAITAQNSLPVIVFYAPSISGNVYLVWKLIFSSDNYGYANSILMELNMMLYMVVITKVVQQQLQI